MQKFSQFVPWWVGRLLSQRFGNPPAHIRDLLAQAYNRMTESHIHRGEN